MAVLHQGKRALLEEGQPWWTRDGIHSETQSLCLPWPLPLLLTVGLLHVAISLLKKPPLQLSPQWPPQLGRLYQSDTLRLTISHRSEKPLYLALYLIFSIQYQVVFPKSCSNKESTPVVVACAVQLFRRLRQEDQLNLVRRRLGEVKASR